MKINVELFGRLSRHVPDYDSDHGIVIEIPDGGSVDDLLSSLNISKSDGCVVLLEGKIVSAGDKLREGASVTILEPLQGG